MSIGRSALILLIGVLLLPGCMHSSKTAPKPSPRVMVADWGFVDTSGRVVIRPQFREVKQFTEGLAPVQVGGKWGYIDLNGEIVITPRFRNASPFSCGMAMVWVGRRMTYIDRKGHLIPTPELQSGGDFSEGLAVVDVLPPGIKASEVDEETQYPEDLGYIDKTGRVVIGPGFDYAGDFHHGRALVSLGPAKRALIDQKGRILRRWRWDGFIRDFSEGLAWLEIGRKTGYLNETGQIAIKPRFYSGGDFSDGMAEVQIGDELGKWGYINKKGQVVIKPRFEDARGFSEGLAAATFDGGAWGYIDKSGHVAIEPQFDEALPFREGRALVRTSSAWGYIDRSGRMVISNPMTPEFRSDHNYPNQSFWCFSEGRAPRVVRRKETDAEYFKRLSDQEKRRRAK